MLFKEIKWNLYVGFVISHFVVFGKIFSKLKILYASWSPGGVCRQTRKFHDVQRNFKLHVNFFCYFVGVLLLVDTIQWEDTYLKQHLIVVKRVQFKRNYKWPTIPVLLKKMRTKCRNEAKVGLEIIPISFKRNIICCLQCNTIWNGWKV